MGEEEPRGFGYGPGVAPRQEVLEISVPFSEVCVFIGVAGRRMGAELLSHGGVQLVDRVTGTPFSFPISPGEAGIF